MYKSTIIYFYKGRVSGLLLWVTRHEFTWVECLSILSHSQTSFFGVIENTLIINNKQLFRMKKICTSFWRSVLISYSAYSLLILLFIPPNNDQKIDIIPSMCHTKFLYYSTTKFIQFQDQTTSTIVPKKQQKNITPILYQALLNSFPLFFPFFLTSLW